LLIHRKLQAVALITLFLLSSNWFSSLAQNREKKNILLIAQTTDAKDAASSDSSDGSDRAANEFGLWGGGSFLTAGISGTSKNVKLGIVGLRYARLLAGGKVATVKYTADVFPLAVLSYLNKEAGQPAAGALSKRPHSVVRAIGSAPLGLQINFRPQHNAQPFANFSGGCLYFNEVIPNEFGKQFNFTAEVGIGLQIMMPSRKAISLGYKLHHISNAGRGAVNPGFGSNLFYLGVSLFK
jgi:hypothetical protein